MVEWHCYIFGHNFFEINPRGGKYFFSHFEILVLHRFKAQSVYNHHLLTHSDERNYKCPFCPKTFKTSVQLSGHKNSHTKPFTCTECNRPFGSLYAVRAHMESHKRTNNNMKHVCDICGAKYARRFALNDHIKEQHKDVQVVQIVDVSVSKEFPLFFFNYFFFCLLDFPNTIVLLLLLWLQPSASSKSKGGSIRKPAAKRAKAVQHYEVIISDEQEVDINDESILPNMVEQEVNARNWFKLHFRHQKFSRVFSSIQFIDHNKRNRALWKWRRSFRYLVRAESICSRNTTLCVNL